MPLARLLVVEDDDAIRRGLVDALQFAGYAVSEAPDGRRAVELGATGSHDLVLLDVMLPEFDGFEVLRQLRAFQPLLPVIFLTARGSEEDRVRGLRGGADDYVVKPFSTGELLARVEAVLRRSAERPHAVPQLRVAGRTIDFERREVSLPDGSRAQLTERESDLLQHLAINRERAVSREELLRCVWGIDPRGVQTRTVDMTIARLREHLGDSGGEPEVVLTVRAKGYALGNVDSTTAAGAGELPATDADASPA
ncbi:response regulator transcription factor [Engelhardtia mirabilis]|uniref:Transcriptional regulatory protein YycF n=1 Tax=Engelhardtia mirabilis TaxID=2528011 RepID=A0A518BLH0_9BACT|nr:Transcriptional regulatory protein YycF [Planctomycetes bacterium Pla133]QDV02144.1 Transcriptional regulatory protein YycF [Planctomycetes bacterium Pla86]